MVGKARGGQDGGERKVRSIVVCVMESAVSALVKHNFKFESLQQSRIGRVAERVPHRKPVDASDRETFTTKCRKFFFFLWEEGEDACD